MGTFWRFRHIKSSNWGTASIIDEQYTKYYRKKMYMLKIVDWDFHRKNPTDSFRKNEFEYRKK